MSSTYNGKSVAITSTTDATPISVVAVAHGYITGDVVLVAHHHVNTNANGYWTITRVDANTFTLNSSYGSGNGVGGANGTVSSFVTSATIPSDGDGPSIKAADVNTPLEAVLDRTQLLWRDFEQRMKGYYPLSPAPFVSKMQAPPGHPSVSTEWTMTSGVYRTEVATAAYLYIPVDLPHQAVWSGYTVYIQPNSHAGAMPAVPYAANPVVLDLAAATFATPAGFTANYSDPTSPAASYAAHHSFGEAAAGTEIVNRTTKRYYLEIISESGANAQTHTLVLGCRITYRITDLGGIGS